MPRIKSALVSLKAKEGHCPHSLGNQLIAAYAATKGEEVSLISCEAKLEIIVQKVLEERLDICGLSANFITAPLITEASRKLKEYSPKILIVIGGPAVTYSTRTSPIRQSDADLFVKGDGEIVFHEIISNYDSIRRNLGSIGIKGVSSKEKSNEEIAIVDLNKMPSPFPANFDSDHFYLETSRGCAFNCIFCSHPGGKNKFREVPLRRVEREIQYLRNLKKLRAVYITDPVLGGSKRNTREILRLLSQLEGKVFITASLRPEYLDKEIIALLESAKIGWLDIGLQTTNRNLSYFRVNRDVSGLQKLAERGVPYNLDLIVGIPGDTLDGLKESIRYVIEEAKPTTFKAFRLRVYDGTRLYQLFVKNSWKFDESNREIQEAQSWGKDTLKEAMRYANFSVLLYKFLEETNWQGNEKIYRSQKFFDKAYHRALMSKCPEVNDFLRREQTDYNFESARRVWRLTNG